MNEGPFIRDIPSIKKTLEEMRAIKSLSSAMPILRPLLRLFGADTDKMQGALADVEALSQQFEDFASIPDRFNNLFSSRGWILYDDLNYEVAKAAVEKAESGDFEAAEEALVEYYTPETVGIKLRRMMAVKAFRPRMRLAEKALGDYRQGRYYACVLVLLSLMDGMVNEVNIERKGFFAKEADLAAWNSIVGHSKGLNALARIMKTGRRKTAAEEIRIPYRHGIMHGMDLGYDNKFVAAKTWAALFALRDWALRAESGRLGPQEEEKSPSWWALINRVREIEEDKARIRQWRPRSIEVGKDVPCAASADGYALGTPERSLVEYLEYWKAGNYGFMSQYASTLVLPDARKKPAALRRAYADKKLNGFQLTEIVDKAPGMTEIHVCLVFVEQGSSTTKSARFRMLHENDCGEACPRGKPGANWKVVNWEV